jgi:hypothetical protein
MSGFGAGKPGAETRQCAFWLFALFIKSAIEGLADVLRKLLDPD